MDRNGTKAIAANAQDDAATLSLTGGCQAGQWNVVLFVVLAIVV